MSLKTLITTAALLVGSSTAALARPVPAPAPRAVVTVRDHRDVDGAWMRNRRERDRDRDGDRDRDRWYGPRVEYFAPSYTVQPTYTVEPTYYPAYQAPVAQQSLVSIQPATALVGGQLKLGVAGMMTGTQTLQIKAAGAGGTYIDSVQLLYLNHQSQTIPVNRSVDPSNPCIDLPLGNGSDISLVIINGQYQGGAISVDAI